ncbi:tRNA (guanosine(46)-N7)-methyltransferase TrmB [Betaproteobacteria bacterium]|nr:tRNA (guanosine(46)-N7)-methyltransferase TrmB [Betaproteobacteria bacterium]
MLRSGRVTSAQKRAIRSYSRFFCVPFSKKELLPEKVFGNNNPLVLDIGFGMGEEIIDFSIRNPTKNILGIEMYKPAIGNLLKNIYDKNIKNIKIVEYDAYLVLNYMIPDESIDEIHIYFPDPWPKKKHIKRRLLDEEFAEIIARKLKNNGEIKCATDNSNYADQILSALDKQKCMQNRNDRYGNRPKDRTTSKFEQKAFDNESKIYEISFQRSN